MNGTALAEANIEDLRSTLRGPVIAQADEGFQQARTIYNAMIDKRPAAIARPVDAADVIACLNFARSSGMPMAVQGGGHSGPGLGLIEGGLTIDLSMIRWVRVDRDARTAQVGGGSTIGDLDHATHAFGLATPAGIMSTTGVGGLTLGGGHGYLTRKYGLTIDNLLAADIVLADGSLVKASESENEDLFWALRGGGGNFGIVTSFTYRLHPVHTVSFGVTLWPVEQTPEVLRWYGEFLPQADEEIYGFGAVLTVPPGPPFPEEIHGQKMCGVVWCYLGDPDEAAAALAPAQAVGKPAFHFSTPMPYPALQSAFDQLIPAGLQWYWRGNFFDSIADDALDVHLDFATRMPTPLSTMHLYPVDGVVHRVGESETAWAYRDALWSGVIGGIDPDPANAEILKEWTVGYFEALHPHSMGGTYLNFMMEEGQGRVKAAYRGNYERLAAIKQKYDPGNVFNSNQNIRPAG
jgi:FAD binding domain-containing protein/berberine-like enzyme